MKYKLNWLFLFIIVISSFIMMKNYKEHSIDAQKAIFIKQAQTHFHDQVNTRHWNASFGGLYVKPKDGLKPNPYLKDNILKVDENLTLIRINPAWMTRQLSEQLNIEGFSFKITSLKPVNPNNTPNEFEKKALKYIEDENTKEYYEFTENSFNYLGALVAKKECLSCHGTQGYKEGDIRGGISITLNTKDYNSIVENIKDNFLITYTLTLIFLVIIFLLIHIQLKNNEKLNEKVKERTKEVEDEQYHTKMIVDTNPDIIIVLKNYKMINANKSFFQKFKYENLEEFLKDHKGICDYFTELDEEFLSEDRSIHGKFWPEYIMQSLDRDHIVKLKIEDQIYHFKLSANRINDEEILMIFTDITDLNKKETQLHKAEKLASMGEMIGNIAHQWRQPLSIISTISTAYAMKKELNVKIDLDKLMDDMDKINNNAQYLSNTIDDFRNFIKGNSKRQKFNLKNDTKQFLTLIDSTIKNNNIKIIIEQLAENANIQGYPNELIQCFINIFNNSKDALVQNVNEEERYIFISETIQEKEIIIKFKDNGGGIPPKILPKIFEPYFTTKHQSQGTGIGLHMTYNLISKTMNGSIEASNVEFEFDEKKYKGAEFTIKLPLYD